MHTPPPPRGKDFSQAGLEALPLWASRVGSLRDLGSDSTEGSEAHDAIDSNTASASFANFCESFG